jgi:hypothetical protein
VGGPGDRGTALGAASTADACRRVPSTRLLATPAPASRTLRR